MSTSMDGISVIVCCYNSSLRLPETIRHLAAQEVSSLLQWEVIFVNNNSTDNTSDVILHEWRKYNLQNVGFKKIDEPRAGQSYARDKGVETAQYNIIVFCDDDNWLCPTYIDTAYFILQNNPGIGAVGGQNVPATDARNFPPWFEEKQANYAVGKQALQSGDISYREFIWGAGMATRKKLFIDAFSKYKSLLPGRSGKILTSGDDNEYCMRLLFMGYRLFYNETLRFVHFIPSGRLTEEYINRLGEGFKTSYDVLSKYSLLLYLRSLSINKKVKTFLFSVVKFLFSKIINTKKWNKNYDALVIYFLTNYRSKFIMQESMLIKSMYHEFKLRKNPQPLKSIGWVNNMRFDVFQTGI